MILIFGIELPLRLHALLFPGRYYASAGLVANFVIKANLFGERGT